jgi:hypothetical protein
MQDLGGGFSHSSLLIDVPLNVNKQSAAELIRAIIANATTPTSQEMRDYLTAENTAWKSPLATIRTLNLASFTTQRWMTTSRREYSAEAQRANQTPLYEVLLLYMIQYATGIKANTETPVLFVGDFEEISKPVEIITSPDFQNQYLEWKAFVPDPYNPNQLNLSETFPLYDRYVNDKWLVGPDGSGLPSDANLQWLKVSRTQNNHLVIGAETRLDYFEEGTAAIRKYYRLCLSVLVACQAGSTACLKITLPTTNGMYGIYSLFSLFFNQTRLVKTRHSPPDDTTAYLIGIDAQPLSLEILNILVDDNQMVKVLAILSSNTNRQLDSDLNRLVGEPTEVYIDRLFRL